MDRKVIGIGTAALLMAAAGAVADNPKVTRNGGAVIEVGAGSPQTVVEVDNDTGSVATDVTVSIEGQNQPNITEVDVLGTDKDKVDDNGNGQLDEGEDDTTADPAAKTVKTILDGANIKKNGKGTKIIIKFDGPTQEGAKIRIKFSTKIGDTHYDMIAMNPVDGDNTFALCSVDTGAAQVAPGLMMMDPGLGIGMIEVFGNPQNPIIDAQPPLPFGFEMELQGPNALLFFDPPLPPQVPLDLGLEFLFPIEDPSQSFDLGLNVQPVPLFQPNFCYADFNEDGVVNILDFIAFQNAWNAHDPAADVNNDGVWNILDFLKFQEEWQLGCEQFPTLELMQNFDDFDLGSSCQGDWGTWDANGACGEITEENARTGEQCLLINADADNEKGDDVVRVIEGVDSGLWHFQCWTYIPAEATGTGWLVLMNTYQDNGAKDYSGIIAFDADLGLVRDNPIDLPNGPQVPMIVDQWVPIDVVVDLENDTCDYLYAGQPLVTGKSWSVGVGGPGQTSFQAVDFYAGEPGQGGISHFYIDDVSLFGQD